MRSMPVARGSLLASFALVLLVGTVFAILQDYGPESSLRVLHESVVQGNQSEFERVVRPGLEDADTQFSLGVLRRILLQEGARYRITRMDRKPAWVGAQVDYLSPTGRVRTVYWIIKKQNRQWRVDSTETWRALHQPAF